MTHALIKKKRNEVNYGILTGLKKTLSYGIQTFFFFCYVLFLMAV